jgi:hypothetical protein
MFHHVSYQEKNEHINYSEFINIFSNNNRLNYYSELFLIFINVLIQHGNLIVNSKSLSLYLLIGKNNIMAVLMSMY